MAGNQKTVWRLRGNPKTQRKPFRPWPETTKPKKTSLAAEPETKKPKKTVLGNQKTLKNPFGGNQKNPFLKPKKPKTRLVQNGLFGF